MVQTVHWPFLRRVNCGMRRNQREVIAVAEVDDRERSKTRQSLGNLANGFVGNENWMNRLDD